VVDSKVFRSSMRADLDEAALRAARMSTYRPEVFRCVPMGGAYPFRVEFGGN
jgi:hypothetical protein